MNKEVFGKFIANTRREMGITQQRLAEQLHVTNAAVSKWERGLCYPDLTLLESLGEALGLTVAELMACKKHSEETVYADHEIDHVRWLLDVANESQCQQQKKVWITVSSIFLAILLLAGLVYLCMNSAVKESGYVSFVGRKENENGCFVYMEESGRLLRLRCKDQQTYNAIITDSEQAYYVEYQWNRFTYHGTLNSCELTSEVVLNNRVTDQIGSSIGYGSLLGQEYVIMEIQNVYPDPQRNFSYLYTFRFFYKGEGKSYYLGKELPETEVLTVDNCRSVSSYDYDGDNIAELFVLTKYDEEPFLIYDLDSGELTSRFVDEIPPEVLEQWQRIGNLP